MPKRPSPIGPIDKPRRKGRVMVETPTIGGRTQPRVKRPKRARGKRPKRKKKVAGMLSRRIRIEGVVVCKVVPKRSTSLTVG